MLSVVTVWQRWDNRPLGHTVLNDSDEADQLAKQLRETIQKSNNTEAFSVSVAFADTAASLLEDLEGECA